MYQKYANIIKAIADENRLRILDILSCGERCACEILKFFEFTQPTLSHHMKILTDSGLVKCRKDGLWCHYRLNKENHQRLIVFLNELSNDKEKCICKEEII